MSATSSGDRAAITREVEAELNRTDKNASTPPSFWDYASDVARRMVTLANERANPPTTTLPDGTPDAVPFEDSPEGLLICTTHDRRAVRRDGQLIHLMDETPCV